jgi:hypothetical protein
MTPLPSLADLFPPYAIQVEVALAIAIIAVWAAGIVWIRIK